MCSLIDSKRATRQDSSAMSELLSRKNWAQRSLYILFLGAIHANFKHSILPCTYRALLKMLIAPCHTVPEIRRICKALSQNCPENPSTPNNATAINYRDLLSRPGNQKYFLDAGEVSPLFRALGPTHPPCASKLHSARRITYLGY